MRRLVTGKQMKEIDGYAIRKVGIPSLVLMERAALAVADEMEKRYGKLSGQRLLVFCGTGNNGADGAALARILFLRGALPASRQRRRDPRMRTAPRTIRENPAAGFA